MKNPGRKLILDSHKLGCHYDRVEAWEAGERIAPVSIDMALTRACGAMCSFCYAMIQESQTRSSIKNKTNGLEYAVNIGTDQITYQVNTTTQFFVSI
jgi:DNA repair photolyase